MKNYVKYIIAAILIAIVSIYIINIVDFNKEDSVRGNLTIWAKNYTYEYLSNEADEFMKEKDKVNIKVVNIDDANYENQVIEAIESGNVPDIIQGNDSFLKKVKNDYGNKVNMDENNTVVDDNLDNFLMNRTTKYNGAYLGVPFISRPLVFYTREDMLETYDYTYEDISTWDDVINVGKNIYERSGGKIKLINAVGKDYEDLISVLVMQAMEESNDEDKIKENVDKVLKTLKENNIINKDPLGAYAGRISSINGMNELEAINQECRWTANNIPSVYPGSNSFYIPEEEKLSIIRANDRNRNLYNSFIEFISKDKDNNFNFIKNKSLFLSFTSVCKSKELENSIKNFSGKSPLIIMENVVSKGKAIKDYDLYNKIYDCYAS